MSIYHQQFHTSNVCLINLVSVVIASIHLIYTSVVFMLAHQSHRAFEADLAIRQNSDSGLANSDA